MLTQSYVAIHFLVSMDIKSHMKSPIKHLAVHEVNRTKKTDFLISWSFYCEIVSSLTKAILNVFANILFLKNTINNKELVILDVQLIQDNTLFLPECFALYKHSSAFSIILLVSSIVSGNVTTPIDIVILIISFSEIEN